MFDWITGFVQSTGYWGIGLLMLAENVFPPIPSELIMPLAGFTAARGDLNIAGVILAGTVGTLMGALIWYHIGQRIGIERLRALASRHGRWLTMDEHDIDRARDWFTRHGRMALVVGHLIPAVRTLISVPAGVNRMPLLPFLAASAVGTLLWTAFLASAGFLLESQYQQVEGYANVATNTVLVLFLAYYAYRVLSWPRARRRSVGQPQESVPDRPRHRR